MKLDWCLTHRLFHNKSDGLTQVKYELRISTAQLPLKLWTLKILEYRGLSN